LTRPSGLSWKVKPHSADELERDETMSVLETLRKGFGFVLMSMGVSSPPKKAKPASPKPAAKLEPHE
jgi:hypothetical protein